MCVAHLVRHDSDVVPLIQVGGLCSLCGGTPLTSDAELHGVMHLSAHVRSRDFHKRKSRAHLLPQGVVVSTGAVALQPNGDCPFRGGDGPQGYHTKPATEDKPARGCVDHMLAYVYVSATARTHVPIGGGMSVIIAIASLLNLMLFGW